MSKETNSLIPQKAGKRFPLILTTIIIFLALGAGVFLFFRDTTAPIIAITPDTTDMGKDGQITITVTDEGSGLERLDIAANQNGKKIDLVSKTLPAGTKEITETIILNRGQIKEGAFVITVSAKDASLYPFGAAGQTTAEKSYTFDATPPRIFVQSHTNNLTQGGAALMIYTLSEKSEDTGIRVGKRFFPAYLQPGTDNQYLYYCMFAHPWDVPVKDFKPVIEAKDKAGNSAKRYFNFHTNARKFRSDRISLSISFMESTIPEFRDVPADKPLLDQYLYINNVTRKQNRARLVEFGKNTSPTMLWSGPFKRLPNAANRARFADARDYMFNGKKVDHQTHLGLDLASLKHAPVPAGNDGKVVYADFLGIYGNVVVLDHGLGLQTLYAHLSSIDVKPDDRVVRGDIIGKTGTTGLAGGDHLHYGVIMSGTPIQPIEWWDTTWIRNNITTKLE